MEEQRTIKDLGERMATVEAGLHSVRETINLHLPNRYASKDDLNLLRREVQDYNRVSKDNHSEAMEVLENINDSLANPNKVHDDYIAERIKRERAETELADLKSRKDGQQTIVNVPAATPAPPIPAWMAKTSTVISILVGFIAILTALGVAFIFAVKSSVPHP